MVKSLGVIENFRKRSFANISKGDRFMMRKVEFQQLMQACGCPEQYTFTYDAEGNDEPKSLYHGVTALYDFTIHAGGTSIMLCWKGHRRTHEEVEQELIEMYSRWANELITDKRSL